MAINKPIEVRHLVPLDGNAIVYVDKFGLIDKATGEPVPFTPAEAVFSISENERAKLQISLGDGLSWDDEAKSFSIIIRNSQTRFIRADGQFDYAVVVKWEGSELGETILEGTVTAVRVA